MRSPDAFMIENRPEQTGYVIQLPRDVFTCVMDNLHPACRYTNIEQWKFPHFWMFAPDGQVVIFAPSGSIGERERDTLNGVAVAS